MYKSTCPGVYIFSHSSKHTLMHVSELAKAPHIHTYIWFTLTTCPVNACEWSADRYVKIFEFAEDPNFYIDLCFCRWTFLPIVRTRTTTHTISPTGSNSSDIADTSRRITGCRVRLRPICSSVCAHQHFVNAFRVHDRAPPRSFSASLSQYHIICACLSFGVLDAMCSIWSPCASLGQIQKWSNRCSRSQRG